MEASEIKCHIGQIVKVQVKSASGRTAEYIISLRQVSDNGFYTGGHPFSQNTGRTESGKSHQKTEDILDIRKATASEASQWLRGYMKFHEETMRDKGYDPCGERLQIFVIPDPEE